MEAETYELLALAARYWFAALGIIIVLRAWRASVFDNRSARLLRDLSPEAGNIGELQIIADQWKDRALIGARYAAPPEFALGSGRAADARIRHRDIKKRHLHLRYDGTAFVLTPARGVRPVAPCRARDGAWILRDGDCMQLGRLIIKLTLYDADMAMRSRDVRLLAERGARADDLDLEHAFDDLDEEAQEAREAPRTARGRPQNAQPPPGADEGEDPWEDL